MACKAARDGTMNDRKAGDCGSDPQDTFRVFLQKDGLVVGDDVRIQISADDGDCQLIIY
jgi:hypothetical protein